MNRLTCPLCGHYIVKRNGVYANAKLIKAEDGKYIMVHKKCPKDKDKMSKSDKIALSNLMNQILYYRTTCPKGYIAEGKFSGKGALYSVKQLYEDGYSFEDQLYALDEIVKSQKGFWGVGALKNNIKETLFKRDLEQKRKNKKQELEKKLEQTKEQKTDLSYFVQDDDFEW